jgi:hypothetical protein
VVEEKVFDINPRAHMQNRHVGHPPPPPKERLAGIKASATTKKEE